MMTGGGIFRAALIALALCWAGAAPAQTVKIGLQKIAPLGPIFIAMEKGYFAAEGLTPQLVFFDASQPIAVATASGDIDFGATGLTAGFYNLAGKGAVRLLASETEEAATFAGGALVASNRAYDAGLKHPRELRGRSVAITQVGSAIHYSLIQVMAKYGIELPAVRILPLQANANSVAAVIGGQADAVLTPITYILPAIQRGEVKLIASVGDEVRWQLGGVFTSTKIANEREDVVRRFLAAFKKGVRDYHTAFVGPDERRRDGPSADAMLGIIAKHIGDNVENVRKSISYVDAEGRLDFKDIARQVDFYKSQKMVDADVDPAKVIDARYAVATPGR